MKHLLVAFGLALTLFLSFMASTAEAGGGGYAYCNSVDSGATAGEVLLRNNCFGPVVVKVATGAEVRWTNKDGSFHNISPVGGGMRPENVDPGKSVTLTFASAGAFPYYCSTHPGMMGVVLVGEAALEATTPSQAVESGTGAPPLASNGLPYPVSPYPATSPAVGRPALTTSGSSEGLCALATIGLALAVGIA